jgi:FSR family fosmidomycin resistance protein-like MFS transporter
MVEPRSSQSWKRTALLFVGHLLNDGFSSFFAPLLPLLIDRLDLSLTLAGLLGTIRIVTNSLLQPGLGHIVDRAQRPGLVIVGPLLTVIAMSLIGRAGSLPALLVIMLVAGIGTAFFHPAAASLVAAEGGRRRGLLMAFFSSGGTLGGAVAPLAIIGFVEAWSLSATPWLALVGFAILAGFAIPLWRGLPPNSRASRPKSGSNPLPGRLVLLWFVIVLASTCSTAFSSFLAVLVVDRGGSTFIGAAAISVYLFAGAAAGFLAGNLSDRLGRKRIIVASQLVATPFLLLFLFGPKSLLLPAIALAGVFGLSSTPVGVVAAQECVPGRTGLVSGLVMGLAWGVGGVALTPIGWLADTYGLVRVMGVVALLPLAAAALMLFFPRRTTASMEDPANAPTVP